MTNPTSIQKILSRETPKNGEKSHFVIKTTQFRPIAFRVFTKKYNLNLNRKSLECLSTYVANRLGSTWKTNCESVLDEIARTWKRMHESTPIVSHELLVPILNSLTVPHEPQNVELARMPSIDPAAVLNRSRGSEIKVNVDVKSQFKVIDAFKMPYYEYQSSRRFFERSTKKLSLLPQAESFTNMYQRRLQVIQHRISQNDAFQSTSFHRTFSNGGQTSITPIRSLLGRAGSDFLLFGQLNLRPDGKPWLEDLDSQVELDVSQCAWGMGWFFPGCLVLVNGQFLENGKFLVFEVCHPPIEKRDATLRHQANLDTLGLNLDTNQLAYIRRAEREFQNAYFVICADLHLDDRQTFIALEKMLGMYENNIDELPVTFIFCGSFYSTAFHNTGTSLQYKEHFNEFATLLEKFPGICKDCQLVFIPGPNDPWTCNGISMLPQQPIPPYFVNRIRRVSKNAIFTSNPSRISFFSREIVIFRDNITGRFQRNSFHVEKPERPTTSDKREDASSLEVHQTQLKRKLVKTLLDQAHLSPFLHWKRPVLWDYDYALSLYPVPDCMAIVDTSIPAFNVHYAGCTSFNPGALIVGNYISWQEVRPLVKQVKCIKEHL
ncbi:DNA polymerase epsilon catalytic subunit B [Schizosaccharomyces japonicus yFS275]|uniref:DNA polymerase epsilon subunit B n=1 Tax=Schizosaccharomyces japonicus (strain yFS275 / FY16936) TaxID=402676 RepID=B6K0V2_SCHJY|nr:DNA polymerase epsilon catalytic subunit B [Schizosaccharomyces japonicus yFS275]EEB07573.1 DNA polymerase epsilon catalytic subunit B [Schizosaccharomyces japonicus yFS275]